MSPSSDEHIFTRYDNEQRDLGERFLAMARFVAQQVRDAVQAFTEGDPDLAEQVVAADREIDQLEVTVDGEIIAMLARRAPLARDLRWVLALSKSVSDLERIGDEAARIAGVVVELLEANQDVPSAALGRRQVKDMAAHAVQSLELAIDTFEQWSEEQARAVIAKDREIDQAFRSDLRGLMMSVREDASGVGAAISVVVVLKALERIGHHAHSLAEYALFHAKGDDVRQHAH